MICKTCKKVIKKRYRNHGRLCNTCSNRVAEKRRLKNKIAIENYKKTKECVQCGFNDYRALHFHHITDDKKFAIGSNECYRKSLKNILKEIEKCVILCANCHFIVHYREKVIDETLLIKKKKR
jgi:Zn ribbon nucleic-acid-binding protein